MIENNEITGHMDLSVFGSIIRNNNIHSDEEWEGVQLRGTGNSFENNTITGYNTALYLEGSDNVIRNNVIKGNSLGIHVGSYANDNIIYGNFFENEINVHVEEGTINFWNTTIGNYWSDYEGTDTDEDGIGDTPYVINDDNVDYRPLVEWPYNPFKPSIVLEVEDARVRLNTTKDMAIWLRDTAAPLGALQFNITFDPTIVEVTSVRLGSGAQGATLVSNILNGTVRVAITSLSGISEGELLKISVQGKNIGSTAVDIKFDIASDVNGTQLQGVEVIPGKVTVYTRKKGDIDEDGRITAVDALLYLRFAVGLDVSPYDIDPALDDVTGDGEITAADALKVLRVAVGLEPL